MKSISKAHLGDYRCSLDDTFHTLCRTARTLSLLEVGGWN